MRRLRLLTDVRVCRHESILQFRYQRRRQKRHRIVPGVVVGDKFKTVEIQYGIVQCILVERRAKREGRVSAR